MADRRAVDRRDCVCGAVHLHSGCPVLKRAAEKLGDGARIGINAQWPDAPYHVGTYLLGDWKSFGAGKTWDEAFENVKKVKYQRGNARFEFEDEKKEKN